MNTRRFPRTLNEAFGPYTSRLIEESATDYPAAWWIAMVLIAVCTGLLVWVTR